jgi:hypothetical protein
MLQILAVVDRLNLEMLLSHEARITRIKKEEEKKNLQNLSKEDTNRKEMLMNTYKAAT